MNPVSASSNGARSDVELRAAARRAYRESLAAQRPVSGTELARQFGMSESWGQARVREVRDEATKTRDRKSKTRDDNARNRDASVQDEDTVTTPRDVVDSAAMTSGTSERYAPAGEGAANPGRHGGRSWLDAAISTGRALRRRTSRLPMRMERGLRAIAWARYRSGPGGSGCGSLVARRTRCRSRAAS